MSDARPRVGRCQPDPPPSHPHGILTGGREAELAGTALKHRPFGMLQPTPRTDLWITWAERIG